MASYGFQDGKPIFSRGDPPRGQIYLLPVGHFSMPSQDQPMHFGDRYVTNSRWPNKAWSTPTLVSNCQRSDSRRREPRECLWVPVLISSSTNRRCFFRLKNNKNLQRANSTATRVCCKWIHPPFKDVRRPFVHSRGVFYRRKVSKRCVFGALSIFYNTCAAFNLKLSATTQAKPSVLVVFSSRPCVVVRCGDFKTFLNKLNSAGVYIGKIFACWHLAIAITSNWL